MEVNYVLKLYPRSGLGFKYRLQLNNTVGIIDSDYYYSDNEGHMFVRLQNHGEKIVSLKKHDRYVQGIFQKYYF